MELKTYIAQYTDSEFKMHKIEGKSICIIKYRLSKLDVVGSACICEINKNGNTIPTIKYYKPRWWRKK